MGGEGDQAEVATGCASGADGLDASQLSGDGLDSSVTALRSCTNASRS